MSTRPIAVVTGGAGFLGSHMTDLLVILVDDVFFHGDVLNATPKTAKGEGVKAFMDFAAGLGHHFRAVLPVCNGLMVIQK
jgi:hypothetical protein